MLKLKLMLLAITAGLVSCASHTGPESTIWLQFVEVEESSYYQLVVTTSRRAGVQADGALISGARAAGQRSELQLPQSDIDALVALLTPEQLDAYQADSLTSPVELRPMTERVFFVSLIDAYSVPNSPAPKSHSLTFRDAAPQRPQTRAFIRKLNEILRKVWTEGSKSGPVVDIAPPPVL